MEVFFRSKASSKKSKPFLVLSVDGKLHLFKGRAISGIVSVKDRHIHNDTLVGYVLEVAKNVHVIKGNESIENKCIRESLADLCDERLPMWGDCAKMFKVTEEEARQFVSTHRPFTAEQIISATFNTVWHNVY